MNTVGSSAPEFDLGGTDERRYRLSDYRGTGVILAFYPGDFTAVCTKQFCSYRDQGDRIDSLGLPMLGISPQSVESHERFRAKHGLNVPLLADPEKQVARAYGVIGLGGRVQRSVFLIDRDLRIRHRHVALLGLRYQDVADLERAVKALA